jgi:hypothetical protein
MIIALTLLERSLNVIENALSYESTSNLRIMPHIRGNNNQYKGKLN